MPVQKQTRAGQRTRFKAFVAIGDSSGHVGLGVKCSKEVATAIRGAIILAKLSVIPVRRGYWGNKIGQPHTVPCKVCVSFLHFILLSNTIVCGLIPNKEKCAIACLNSQLLQSNFKDNCGLFLQIPGCSSSIKVVFCLLCLHSRLRVK